MFFDTPAGNSAFGILESQPTTAGNKTMAVFPSFTKGFYTRIFQVCKICAFSPEKSTKRQKIYKAGRSRYIPGGDRHRRISEASTV